MKPMTLTVALLCTTIILSPLYVIRWHYFGTVPTTFLELLIGLTTISWLCEKRRQPFVITLPRKLWMAISLILAGGIIGIIAANNHLAALGIFRAYFVEPILFFIMLTDLLSQSQNNQFKLFNREYSLETLVVLSLITAAWWISLWGLFQVVLGWGIVTDHQWDRAHAVFNNGNALALFVGPLIVLLFSKRHQLFNPPIVYGIATVLIAGVIASRSLGGILAVLSGGLLYLLQRKFPANYLRFILVLITFGFFIFLGFISTITPKVDNPWIRQGSTATIRACVWEGTRNLLYSHPLTGSGLSMFSERYSAEYTTCDAEPLAYPHNIFLNFWVEIGMVGLVGMLLLWWIIFRSKDNPYTLSFLVILIHGLVDVPYFKNDLALIFWVMVSLWLFQEKKVTPAYDT